LSATTLPAPACRSIIAADAAFTAELTVFFLGAGWIMTKI
jgi:hypothetical protein